MNKRLSVFVVFCLSLTTLAVLGFNVLSHSLDRDIDAEIRVAQLQRSLSERELQLAVLQNQVLDLKNSILEATPAEKQLADVDAFTKLRVQSIHQFARAPASVEPVDLSRPIFTRAKENFLAKKFKESAEEFQRILDDYPLSTLLVESHFFLLESQFRAQNYKAALRVIDKMIMQFPDSDLTGYGLIRMGQISEIQKRPEEALEIYKTVALNFKDPKLVRQAQLLVTAIEVK